MGPTHRVAVIVSQLVQESLVDQSSRGVGIGAQFRLWGGLVDLTWTGSTYRLSEP